MARVPESEIERLKKEISVERLATARGVELKKHGADLIGRCPFHEERTPSLVISPNKNLWHCLGACQAGGTVIDWVMRTHGVSFREAMELLRADHLSLAAGDPLSWRSYNEDQRSRTAAKPRTALYVVGLGLLVFPLAAHTSVDRNLHPASAISADWLHQGVPSRSPLNVTGLQRCGCDEGVRSRAWAKSGMLKRG